jgi:hypothetical protein
LEIRLWNQEKSANKVGTSGSNPDKPAAPPFSPGASDAEREKTSKQAGHHAETLSSDAEQAV